jgi:DNA-binding transcriptional MocR family regulator
MDLEIASTLAELERKLHELERALTAIGRGEDAGADGAALASEGSIGGSRLVDEAIERESTLGVGGERTVRVGGSARAARDAGARSAGTLSPPDPGIASTRGSLPVQGAGPADPPDAAELLRFRERLDRTARELTHDYDELLGRLRYAAVAAAPGPTISFARGAPSLDIIDVEGLSDAAVRAFESDPSGTTAYGTSIGYPRLRAWIADRHGVEPERVLVTNGSMQADAFLFEHLVDTGDDVVVERPTYDRTLLSLRQRGARLHAIELQPDGIDTVALARLLTGRAGARPKLAHIIPNFQNPAGYTLSLAKREALLALAAQYGFIVFEDDPYVALRFSGESLPTMLSMDPERVVYASSFSKTVCPGIRVGYLVGPPVVIDAIAQLATNTYISPNMVSQSIVYEFCASGAIERSIDTVRAALAERSDTLAQALRSELPDAEFVTPDGGYFMWVTLPAGTDVHRLHQAAGERGVAFVKGTDFLLDGGENTLRLAYAGVTPAQIEEGVGRLAAAYRSL